MSTMTIRELHDIGELAEVISLVDSIWQPRHEPAQPILPAQAPVSLSMLRALSHAGNYVAGAFQDGKMVGASVGFFGAMAAGPAASAGLAVLHSHVTGAIAPGVGWELKQHQRRWALDRGLSRITWTFDPLVRRNAHFNLAKLGARPVEYLPRFYGTMDDGINAGDESDRMLMSWDLNDSPPPPRIDGAAVALEDQGGHPVRATSGAARLLVAVPEDIESLRQRDASVTREWRIALREVLGGLLAEGARVTGFIDISWYVVERAGS